jgi:hypothetical protein
MAALVAAILVGSTALLMPVLRYCRTLLLQPRQLLDVVTVDLLALVGGEVECRA